VISWKEKLLKKPKKVNKCGGEKKETCAIFIYQHSRAANTNLTLAAANVAIMRHAIRSTNEQKQKSSTGMEWSRSNCNMETTKLPSRGNQF